MPALSDKEILDSIRQGFLVVEPLIQDNIQPASIDLTLDDYVTVVECDGAIDVTSEEAKSQLKKFKKEVDITSPYTLKSGQCVVGKSKEHIVLPLNINGAIFNRNSLALIGLDAGITQYINPGFDGHKIIAIRNNSNHDIVIKSGIRICQLVLFNLTSDANRSYEDRHDEFEVSKNLDNPISEFMNEEILRVSRGIK